MESAGPLYIAYMRRTVSMKYSIKSEMPLSQKRGLFVCILEYVQDHPNYLLYAMILRQL